MFRVSSVENNRPGCTPEVGSVHRANYVILTAHGAATSFITPCNG